MYRAKIVELAFRSQSARPVTWFWDIVVRTAFVYCSTPFTTVFGVTTYLSRYALVTGSIQAARGAHAVVGPAGILLPGKGRRKPVEESTSYGL